MANDRVYIFDENNNKLNIYEGERIDLSVINDDPIIEIIKIYEPGPQGPKGNDGGSYVLPENVVSSSQQISSDISGSFGSISSSLGQRISAFETKTLFSGSSQVIYNQISGIPAGILSSSQDFVLNYQTSSFLRNEYSSSIESKIFSLEQYTSSYAIKTEITGAFNQISGSLANRISTFEFKTLVSSSQQIQYNQISGIPSGILSSSQGFVLNSETSSFLKNDYSSSVEIRFGRLEIQTSSYATISSLTPIYQYTSSANSRIQTIELATASFALKVEISGAFGLASSSLSQRISVFESKTLISSSAQINTGSFTGSFKGDGSQLIGLVSASYALTASYISGSNSLSSSYATTSSYSLFTLSASYAPIPSNLISSSQQVVFGQISNIPVGLVSGSDQLTGSYDLRYEQKSSNIISSSQQIASDISGAFAQSSSSLQSRLNSIETKTLFSSSQQVDYNLIQNKPSSSLTSSYSLTASFALNIQTIGVRIISYDSFIGAGTKAFKHVGYDSEIKKIRGIANTTGSIDLNIKRNNILLGNYQLINQTGSIDSTLSGWTVILNRDDLIEFYVSQSSTYITDLTFFMDIQNR